jgi:hypothetical protein
MDIFGDREDLYIIWILNLYAFFLYWVLGALLMTMQKLKIPKSIENFKIQAKESEIEKSENLINVRSFKLLARSEINYFSLLHCKGY